MSEADTDDEESSGENAESDEDESDGESAAASILEVRESVIEVAPDLIGRPLDGVSAVEQPGDGDGWRASVEVIERRAVPDSSDILGEYHVDLDGDGTVTGYRRVRRFRRGDTDDEEF